MMEDDKRSLIRVDVQVNVSIPGLAAAVEQYHGLLPGRAVGRILIDIPTSCAKVLTGSPSGTGSICAKGRLTAKAQGDTVYAKVYQGSAPMIPHSHPSCSSCTTVFDGTYYNWAFTGSNLLPGAACAATCSGSQAAPNVLAVWTNFGSGDVLQTQPFNGLCSNHTDCDGSGPGAGFALATAGYPVLAAPAAGETHPPLTATVVRKTGRFAALPDRAEFTWNDCQQGWVWVPEQARCGTFTLLPCKDWFLLHSTVSNPPLIPAQAGGTLNPLHLVFELTAAGESRRPERLVLEVGAAGGSSPRRPG
jgi:hypothetical protein